MLRDHVLFEGCPVPDFVVVEMVDEVLVPLYRAGDLGDDTRPRAPTSATAQP